jgi:phosphoribosylanthranilate isomerase
MLTQIYEVSAPEEARSISAIAVDHMRVLDGNGEFPRELSLETAAKVAAAVISPWKVSALFLTADMALIEEWARQLQPAILHLGAAPELLSLEDAAMLKAKLSGILLMRSIPVIGEISIDIARNGIADFLLLDSHRDPTVRLVRSA